MNKDVPTFEALCAKCEKKFDHPSLGDFVYGEAILSTRDGKHCAWVSGFSEFSQKVADLVRIGNPGELWNVLASLSDQIEGQSLSPRIVCPHCSSVELKYWGGDRIGTITIPEASFESASKLDEAALRNTVETIRCNDA